MHPYISMEMAQARRQDDLRRAESFRRSKLARQARAEERRAPRPVIRFARRGAPVPDNTAAVRPLRNRPQTTTGHEAATPSWRRSA